MNKQIISYIYKMCLEKKESIIQIPSIRWFVYKYKLSQNEVIKTFEFFKVQNLFISEQGSKTLVVKKPFLNLFKNDTWKMFGDNVERKIISQSIIFKNNVFEHTFKREFIIKNKVVSISVDKIYNSNKKNINLNNGVDNYVRNNFIGKKIVQRETIAIDINRFKEYEQIKERRCILTETKIFNKNKILTHSFSLTPWNYFRDFKNEIMI